MADRAEGMRSSPIARRKDSRFKRAVRRGLPLKRLHAHSSVATKGSSNESCAKLSTQSFSNLPSGAEDRHKTRSKPSLHATESMESNTPSSPEVSGDGQVTAELQLPQVQVPGILFTLKRQRKPENWQIISLVAKPEAEDRPADSLTSDDAAAAYCSVCKSIISYSKGQTSSVGSHMRQYHPERLVVRKKARGQGPLVNEFISEAPVETSKVSVQATKEQQAHLKYLMAKWCAESQRPLSMVEDRGLLDVMQFVTEGISGMHISVPSRAAVSNEVQTVASQLRASLKARIKRDAEYYSATTDIWSDRGMRSFMSLTIHYLETDFTLNDWTLEVEPLPGKHTGHDIANALRVTYKRWGLDQDRCVRLVRDGAANAVAATTDLGTSSFSCFAHCLHLVVSGALIKKRSQTVGDVYGSLAVPPVAPEGQEQPHTDATDTTDEDTAAMICELQTRACEETDNLVAERLDGDRMRAMASTRETVQVFRALAVYFKNSPKARWRLEKIRDDVQKGTQSMFAIDCPTRWSSTWDMLSHFVKLELTVNTFFAYLSTQEGKREFSSVKLVAPSPQQWFAIRCLLRLLEPFALAVEHLSGSRYPTLSVAFPILRFIKRELMRGDLFDVDEDLVQDPEVTASVKTTMVDVQSAMLKLLRERFRGQDQLLMWVSFLDPRLTDCEHLDDSEREYAKQLFISKAIQFAQSSDGAFAITRPATGSSGPSLTTTIKAKAKMKSALFGRRAKQHTAPVPQHQAPSLSQMCELAVDVYLRASGVVDAEADPLEWWHKNHREHRLIAALARKYLSVVATSVPSERAFSTGGNVVTAKRCSLAPTMVRDIVFVSQNTRLKTSK